MLVNKFVKLSLDIFSIWLIFCCNHSLFNKALAEGNLSKFHIADTAESEGREDDDVAGSQNVADDDDIDEEDGEAAADNVSILSNSFDDDDDDNEDNKMEYV